jgi:hypothetical protein
MHLFATLTAEHALADGKQSYFQKQVEPATAVHAGTH